MRIGGGFAVSADYDFSGNVENESSEASRICTKRGPCGEPILDITTTSSSGC